MRATVTDKKSILQLPTFKIGEWQLLSSEFLRINEKQKHSLGRIFSPVPPFYERAVSDLDP
jgi:hypothetical protein